MAIQILEEKKENNLCNQYIAECSFCGSKITYLGLDIKFHRNYPLGFIYCPKCRRPIPHKEENRFEGGTSPEEIKTKIVDNLTKQKDTTKKAKTKAMIIGVSLFVITVAMCIVSFIGAFKSQSDIAFLYTLLLFLGILGLMAAIAIIAASSTVYENRLKRIDDILNKLNAKYLD